MKLLPSNTNIGETGKGYDASRRRFFQLTGGIAGAGVLLKMASTALPMSALSLFQQEKGKTKDSAVESLNVALELEYFEYAFYHIANNSPGLIPAQHAPGFKTIESHEKSHIDLLTKTITDLGGVSFKPNNGVNLDDAQYAHTQYDFTRGGVYPVFTDYATFLMTSQAIENAGLRAYNALFESLSGNPVLGKIQRIATAEASHADHSRMIRREMNAPYIPSQFLVHNLAPLNVGLKTNYNAKSRYIHLGMV